MMLRNIVISSETICRIGQGARSHAVSSLQVSSIVDASLHGERMQVLEVELIFSFTL
jgi:hypothetical protein